MRRPRTIEVLDVRPAEPDRNHLKGLNIDAPKSGTRGEGSSLTIGGWVVGRKCRVAGVEVISGEEVVAQAPVEMERVGVARAYKDAPGAHAAGFRMILAGEGNGEDELVLRAALEDGTRVPLGAVRVKLARHGLLSSPRRSRWTSK